MNEHNKQIHECQKDGTCTVIDRGLANCAISGDLCDRDRCPKNVETVVHPETMESLDKRITNIETRLGTVIESLRTITNMFENISSEQMRLYRDVEYDLGTLESNTAYLEDVGDGEVY